MPTYSCLSIITMKGPLIWRYLQSRRKEKRIKFTRLEKSLEVNLVKFLFITDILKIWLRWFFIFIILTIIILLVVGFGDVTYNSRRSVLAAIPVTEKIAYHLFNVDAYASNTKEIVKLSRKSKWHSQISTQQRNWFLFAAKHPFTTFSC